MPGWAYCAGVVVVEGEAALSFLCSRRNHTASKIMPARESNPIVTPRPMLTALAVLWLLGLPVDDEPPAVVVGRKLKSSVDVANAPVVFDAVVLRNTDVNEACRSQNTGCESRSSKRTASGARNVSPFAFPCPPLLLDGSAFSNTTPTLLHSEMRYHTASWLSASLHVFQKQVASLLT